MTDNQSIKRVLFYIFCPYVGYRHMTWVPCPGPWVEMGVLLIQTPPPRGHGHVPVDSSALSL